MSVVFIGGSRRIKTLDNVVRGRLDNIIGRKLAVIIGDADGADQAVQTYLSERSHKTVTVYCTGGVCRNNVGAWPVRAVKSSGERGFAYYALKDAEMTRHANCGFMIWDGVSKGTLLNILRMTESGKPVLLYFAPTQECLTIRAPDEIAALVTRCTGPIREGLLRAVEKQRRDRTLFSQRNADSAVGALSVKMPARRSPGRRSECHRSVG